MNQSTHIVCKFAELENPSSRSFTIGAGDWPLRGFVVRVDERVFAYVNRCPHAGHPLNLRPHDFLSADKTLILCRSHAATFERETGKCVWGPCAGQSLRALSVRVEGGLVLLELDREVATSSEA
jgi:nitrite reductase/ring-hydroxylating ferredoxin subunit